MATTDKMIASLVAMAAADGRIGKRELALIEAYRLKWKVSRETLDQAVAEAQAGKKRLTLPKESKARRVFLKALVKVAAVDGVIDPGERKMLEAVAGKMELGRPELEALIERALAKQGAMPTTDSDIDYASTDESDPPGGEEPVLPTIRDQPAVNAGAPDALDPNVLLSYIAVKQQLGEPIPPELQEMARLLVAAGLPAPPPQEPDLLTEILNDSKKRLILLGVAILFVVVPLLTGMVGASSRISEAHWHAELDKEPSEWEIGSRRDELKMQQKGFEEQQQRQQPEREQVEEQARTARDAPTALEKLAQKRDERWAEFRRLCPKGPQK